MKKIVSILAVAALATSIFAADVAACIQGYGNIFGWSTAKDAKVNVMGWNDPWDREFSWYSTGIGFNFSGDKAGLNFELDNRDVTVKNSSFWIQPLDMLKITLGATGIGLAKENIDYAGTVYNNDFAGFVFTLAPVDGLTIDAGLVTGQPGGWSTNYWINAGKVGETIGAITYAADFGSVKAVADYTEAETIVALDYAGNFGGVSVSPAVSYAITGKTVKADLHVQATAAGIGMNLYTLATIPTENTDGTTVAVNTKFSMGTSIGNASLQIKDNNVLAKQFAMMVKAALDFNCGCAGMQVAVQADIADTVELSVPFMYNIHF